MTAGVGVSSLVEIMKFPSGCASYHMSPRLSSICLMILALTRIRYTVIWHIAVGR